MAPSASAPAAPLSGLVHHTPGRYSAAPSTRSRRAHRARRRCDSAWDWRSGASSTAAPLSSLHDPASRQCPTLRGDTLLGSVGVERGYRVQSSSGRRLATSAVTSSIAAARSPRSQTSAGECMWRIGRPRRGRRPSPRGRRARRPRRCTCDAVPGRASITCGMPLSRAACRQPRRPGPGAGPRPRQMLGPAPEADLADRAAGSRPGMSRVRDVDDDRHRRLRPCGRRRGRRPSSSPPAPAPATTHRDGRRRRSAARPPAPRRRRGGCRARAR